MLDFIRRFLARRQRIAVVVHIAILHERQVAGLRIHFPCHWGTH